MAARAQKYTITLAGNGSNRLLVMGSFVKVLAASGPVKIESDFGTLNGLTAGQGMKDVDFKYLFFTDESGGANVVTVLVADREFIDASLSTVVITSGKAPQSAAGTQALKSVGIASASLVAANPNRQYLFIQNLDAATSIHLNMVGAAAVVGSGVLLKAGEDFTFPHTVLTSEIRAIAGVVNNNVLVVEG